MQNRHTEKEKPQEQAYLLKKLDKLKSTILPKNTMQITPTILEARAKVASIDSAFI